MTDSAPTPILSDVTPDVTPNSATSSAATPEVAPAADTGPDLAADLPAGADLVEVTRGRPRMFPVLNPIPTGAQIREGFESGRYPYARLLGRIPYEAEKARLQAELLKVQIWAQDTGQKFVVLFEGRDAAGKGGTIKRFMEHLNPRYARVVALTKPSDKEKGEWFFQRNSQAPLAR